MAKRRGFRSGSFLGVDIGSARIKVVELNRAGGGMSVRAVGAALTPAGVVQEGRITDAPAVGRVLRDILGRSGVKSREAVASVNGQVAIIREIQMPSLPPAELKQAARFEVERYLPYPISEVTYDTFVMGEVKENGNTRVDVLVVAARSDILNQHIAALRAAGLEPVIMDVEPFALTRAMAGKGEVPENRVVIFIHIGAENTGIVIVEGSLPRVMRTVAFGGNTVTRLLADRLGLEFEKAEAAKLQLGGGSHDGDVVSDPHQLEEAAIASLGDLTVEVRRSLDYFEGRYRGAVPERAVVTGGGALLPGLTRYLSSDLGVPVELGDPFAGLNGTPGEEPGPLMAVAVGLARRGADEP